MFWFVLLSSVLALTWSDCVIVPEEIEEKWGFVDVRPKAHQFWWFMKTPCEGSEQKPIIIWLQGGPGGSGTGYGNFMEIGPLTNNMEARNHTWLKEGSLLFIDSPVGSGFSYVDDDSAYTTTVYEVAEDLVVTLGEVSTLLKNKFYGGSSLPPIFIFSESYGGKVAPVFGSQIVAAQKNGLLKDVKLGGVAIGDGAVSLVDAGATYPDILFQTSQIDYNQYLTLKAVGDDLERHYAKGDYQLANIALAFMMEMIPDMTDDVFFYNIRYHHQPSPSLMKRAEPTAEQESDMAFLRKYYTQLTEPEKMGYLRYYKESREIQGVFKGLAIDYNGENVKKLMNTQMREKFGIIPDSVKWGGQALHVYEHLADELIIDVIDSVDECLKENVRVINYNGMLDMIINSAGQDKWINKLKWSGLEEYYSQDRVPLYPPSLAKDLKTGAFYKAYDNFEYYWILMSGHMVPIDAPEMAREMVKRVVNNEGY